MLIIFYGPFVYVYIYSRFFGRQEITNTAKMIASDESDPEIVLNRIADWLKEHMTYDTSQFYFYPIPPFRLWRMSHPDPTWIMAIKRGGCEEHATLFTEMVRSIGIQSRAVHNPGKTIHGLKL